MAFQIADLDEAYALEIRRGIVQFHENVPEQANIVLSMEKDTVTDVLTGQKTFVSAVEDGSATLSQGNLSSLERFLSYFEPPNPGAIRLVAR